MNRKHICIAVLFAVIILALLQFQFLRTPNARTDRTPTSDISAPVSTPPASGGAVVTIPPDPHTLQKVRPHPEAVSFGRSPDKAASEPKQLLEILRFYQLEFGSFPPGQENEDVMNALTGNNPARLPIFPREHSRMDKKGRLLDAWGNPFIFHPVSSQYLEVRSKGPDGEIFTDDDILAPPAREGGF
ncbi:MAG: type II secretion system protein GspG [Verrucomicrobiota bacterium]